MVPETINEEEEEEEEEEEATLMEMATAEKGPRSVVLLTEEDTVGLPAVVLTDAELQKRRGGRPSNISKEAAKKEEEDASSKGYEARNWIIQEILRRDALGESFFHAEVIREGEIKFKLPTHSINASTISMRLKKDVSTASKPGPKGPLEGVIEDTIADMLLGFAKYGFPLNRSEIIELANRLVKGTLIEEAELRKKVKETNENKDGQPSEGSG